MMTRRQMIERSLFATAALTMPGLFGDPIAKKTLLADFEPIQNSRLGELSANFEIHLDRTVEELDEGAFRGLCKQLGGGIEPLAQV